MTTCCLITFGCYFAISMRLPVMPLHARNRGLSVAQIGIIFLVQALANAVSRIPFGAMSDRIAQRKYLVVGGIIIDSLSIIGFGRAIFFYQFVLAGLGLGTGHGLAFTSIGALIAETVNRHLRGPAMGGYNACIYFGMMTGSMVYGPVIEALGFVQSLC